MNDDVEVQSKRFTLKGWHLALMVLLVLVGLIGLYVAVHRGESERRIAALRAAGYPTTFAELAEYTRLPEGVENAASAYEIAFAAFVPPADDANVLILLGQVQWPDRGAPLPEPKAKAVEECLAANRQCLTLLHKAAGIAHCRYDHDYGRMLPWTRSCRHSEQLLHVSAVYHAGQGNTEAAATAIEDGVRLSDSLQKEPSLIGHLVRIACLDLTLNALERSLSLATFTDGQLKDLGNVLTRTGATLDLTRALVTERCAMIGTWRDPSRLGLARPSLPVRMLPGMRRTWLSDTLNCMEAYIEASQLPPVERLRRFRKISSEIQELSFLHAMMKGTASAITRAAELDLGARAHLELARTALAVERYRLASGKLPERLEELVPQYLNEVPSDPFDGNPLRYRRVDPGYCLYSISEDGQDNGGKEKADVPSGAPYDWCFTVTR
ncbi:MAG: hypothetical protein M1376_18170 [Planctomycetes bacterium]|nr:hypothetical protein [Planctomycetota bacterium]